MSGRPATGGLPAARPHRWSPGTPGDFSPAAGAAGRTPRAGRRAGPTGPTSPAHRLATATCRRRSRPSGAAARAGQLHPYLVAGSAPLLDDFGDRLVPALRAAVAAGVKLVPGAGVGALSLSSTTRAVAADLVRRGSAAELTVLAEVDGRRWRGDLVPRSGGTGHLAGAVEGTTSSSPTSAEPLSDAWPSARRGAPLVVDPDGPRHLPRRRWRPCAAREVASSDDGRWRCRRRRAPACASPSPGARRRTPPWTGSGPTATRGATRRRPVPRRAARPGARARRLRERSAAPAGPRHRPRRRRAVARPPRPPPPPPRCPTSTVTEVQAPTSGSRRARRRSRSTLADRTARPHRLARPRGDGQRRRRAHRAGRRARGAHPAATSGSSCPTACTSRIDRPEFAQLAELVDGRGASCEEQPSATASGVGTHDLGLWDELAEVGIVDAQAAQWVRAAQALRDLVDAARGRSRPGVEAELRPYQLDGFRWLAFLWQSRLGGILADDMGLGKTLQTLALVAHARAAAARRRSSSSRRPASCRPGRTRRRTFTPGLRRAHASPSRRPGAATSIADVRERRRPRRHLVHPASGSRPPTTSRATGAGWCSTRRRSSRTTRARPTRRSAGSTCPFRLALTGTPMENRLMELWSLLSIVAPGLYPWPQRFAELVANPVEQERRRGRCSTGSGARIRPFLLRRTKELVAADLPPKQEQVLEVAADPAAPQDLRHPPAARAADGARAGRGLRQAPDRDLPVADPAAAAQPRRRRSSTRRTTASARPRSTCSSTTCRSSSPRATGRWCSASSRRSCPGPGRGSTREGIDERVPRRPHPRPRRGDRRVQAGRRRRCS